MRKLPPLKSLLYFDAAARHLNFSHAADELCVTHSAVSHQIKNLESWAGKALFVRTAKGVELSSTGKRLMQDCQRSFTILEQFSADIKPQKESVEIILGAPSSFQANWLLPKIAEFEQLNPSIKMQFTSQYQPSDLVKKKVDGIIFSDSKTPNGVNTIELFSDRIGPVHSPKLKVSAKTPEKLKNYMLISTRSRPQAWFDWADTVGVEHSKLNLSREVDSLSLMIQAAKASLGVAIAPQILIKEELKRGELVAPFGFTVSEASFMYCFEPSNKKIDSLHKLQQWLVEKAKAEYR